MARMMRRLIALVIALSMMTGIVVLPAGAEDTPPAETTATVKVEITNDSGDVIGEKITTTTTGTTDTTKEYSQETKTDSTWESQNTETTGEETKTEGDTTTVTTTEVKTEVTGSETSQDNVHTDKTTGTQTYSGTTSGSEDTTITETTTTVTTTTGVSLEDSSRTEPVKETEEYEQWSDLELVEEGSWNLKVDENNDFEMVEGSEKTEKTEEVPIDINADPLEGSKSVTLEMEAPTGNTPDTDKEYVYISIEEALEGNIQYTDGQVLDDGSVVSHHYAADGKTVTGYTITKTTPTGSGKGGITETESTDAKKQGDEETVYIEPSGYTEGTADIVDNTGKKIGTKTIEKKTDDEGRVYYTITEEVISSTGAAETIQPLPTPGDSYTLPPRPKAPEPITDHGLTTTVTVEDVLDGNGDVIGYKTTETVTDEDGNEISMRSETIYGTRTSHSSTLRTTPTSDEVVTTTVTTVYGTLNTQNYTKTVTGSENEWATQDVSQQVWNLVQDEDDLYFLFEGKMYKVRSINGEDYQQGDIAMKTLEPNLKDLVPGSEDGDTKDALNVRNPEDFTVSGGISSGYQYQYVGYGVESAIRVDYGTGNTLAHQFILKDENGKEHYVLCADFSIDAERGTSYNMENVVEADYFDSNTAQKVEAIAVSGYWGTDSGVGSLTAVKNLLKNAKANGTPEEKEILKNFSETEINNLTPGQALTATQAALWYYADSNGKTSMGDSVTGRVYGYYESLRDATSTEKEAVDTLYQFLINLDSSKTTNKATELLNETNFATEAELVIKEKATDSSGKVETHTNGREKYVTDLTFTVDVKKSDLTGNLTVTITDSAGNELHEPIQIATGDSGLLGQFLAKESTNSTEIILKDLKLPEGTKFDLNLSGIQNLAQGAYLYSAEVYTTSQTFIGVASGQQEVNLSVQMEFSVTDPDAEFHSTEKTWKERKENNDIYTREDLYQKERKGRHAEETVTVDTRVIATLERTDITVKETDLHREWRSSYYNQVFRTEETEKKTQEDLTKEETTLADAPRTGDPTLMLALACLFSAGGLVGLNGKRKDEE